MPRPISNPEVRDQRSSCRHHEGAFVLRSMAIVKIGSVGGPYFPDAPFAMNYDGPIGRNKLWAAVTVPTGVLTSARRTILGKTWTEPETYGVSFPTTRRLR